MIYDNVYIDLFNIIFVMNDILMISEIFPLYKYNT
jgi:hypothetical protein